MSRIAGFLSDVYETYRFERPRLTTVVVSVTYRRRANGHWFWEVLRGEKSQAVGMSPDLEAARARVQDVTDGLCRELVG